MSNLYDSSAIFRAIKENTVEALLGNYTTELARYELGNTIWKKTILQKEITYDESKKLIRLLKQVLYLMETLRTDCQEEQILDLAGKLKLTFYDASYVFHAKERNLTLVTEDETLTKKASAHKVLGISEELSKKPHISLGVG